MPDVLQAIATPRRREILRLLWHDELCVGEVHARFADVSLPAVSQHLRCLESARLVVKRREGRRRYYRANKEPLGAVREQLEAMWSDALYELKLAAELEQARRGPRTSREQTSRRS